MKSFLRILRYVSAYRSQVLLNIFFNILSVIFSLFTLLMVIPFLEVLFNRVDPVLTKPLFSLSTSSLRETFNYYVSQIKLDHGDIAALIFICTLVLLTSLLKNLFTFLALYVMETARGGVARDLRNQLYRKILDLPLSYFSKEKKGDIMARMSNDVQHIEGSMLRIVEVVFKEPFTIIIYLVTLFIMHVQLTVMILFLLPVAGLIIGRLGRNLKNASQKSQSKLGQLLAIIEETLSGQRIIKAFHAADFFETRFKKENQSYFGHARNMQRQTKLASPLSEFLGTVVVVVVLYFGSRLVLQADSSLGPETFIGFIVIFSQIINPAKAISNAWFFIQQGAASVERLEHILTADNKIDEAVNAISMSSFAESIRYQNVGFTYDTQAVLNNIDIIIPKGQIFALVGQSGAGKSTFADLLPRFYDVNEGQIMIDGQDIRNLKLADLRKLIGVVTQESILFNDTVFNNIAFGNPKADDEKVIHAAQIAGAHEFIMQLEQGYQSIIGDRGSRLSGGERQRLTIARAVLKDPQILILDEATSSLDSESEHVVQEALQRLMHNRTSIVIAHRLTTIQHADQILVMKAGQIIEQGTHEELIRLNGEYSRMVELQAF